MSTSAAGAQGAASGRLAASAGGTRGADRPTVSATVSALTAALAAEQAAVYGYGVAGAHLAGAQQAAAARDWVAHQVARDDLEAMLRSLGAEPVPAAPAYQLPAAVLTAHDAVTLAVALEDRTATAYLGVVAVSAPAIRHFGALRLRATALRAAFWRGTTVAFPGLPASVPGLSRPRP
jgi:hypothetical protein